MNVERYVMCGVTGDRSEMAEFILLRVTPNVLDTAASLLEGVRALQKKVGGPLDVTKRGDVVEFGAFYDVPEADYPEMFEMVDAREYDDNPIILPVGFSGRKFSEACSELRIELCGLQVWANGNIRLTCYPKETSTRIESADNLQGVFRKLTKDFNCKK
jgi:hypothetical protein